MTRPHYIQEHISLADKNWFKTGGPARYFSAPRTALEFQNAISYANQNQLPIFILGHGANILISDQGFNGLVIQPQLFEISYQDSHDHNSYLIKAGAGVILADLITSCFDHNLIGLEEFSGIPGTIGGSVFINVHYFQFLLSHFLVQAEVIDKKTNTIQTVSTDWFNFGYNRSKLQENNHYLATATFKVHKATALQTAFARGRSTEIIRHRANRYPNNNTCGSFFRNFHDHEVTLISNNKKIIFVAYYLDKIGIKGTLRQGDAIVSYQHANMIVNQGKATTADIIAVAREMQQQVFSHFTILPQPECRLIGFQNYPLL